jgi:hypothetical protein
MADTGWLQIIGAALGGGFVGGFTLKILGIGYQDFSGVEPSGRLPANLSMSI